MKIWIISFGSVSSLVLFRRCFSRCLAFLGLVRGLLGVWSRSSFSICHAGRRDAFYGLLGCVQSYDLCGVSGIIGLLKGGIRTLVRVGLSFAIIFLCVLQFRKTFCNYSIGSFFSLLESLIVDGRLFLWAWSFTQWKLFLLRKKRFNKMGFQTNWLMP